MKQSNMDPDKRSNATGRSNISSLADRVEKLGKEKATLERRIKDLEERVTGTSSKDEMSYNFVVEKQMTQMQWSHEPRDSSSGKGKATPLQSGKSLTSEESGNTSPVSYGSPRRAVLKIQQLPNDEHKPRTVVSDKGEVFIIYSPSQSATKVLGKEDVDGPGEGTEARTPPDKLYLRANPQNEPKWKAKESEDSSPDTDATEREADVKEPKWKAKESEDSLPNTGFTEEADKVADRDVEPRALPSRENLPVKEVSFPQAILDKDPGEARPIPATEPKPQQHGPDMDSPDSSIYPKEDDPSSYNQMMKDNEEWKDNVTKLLELLVRNAYRDQVPKPKIEELMDPATRDKALAELRDQQDNTVVVPPDKIPKEKMKNQRSFFFDRNKDRSNDSRINKKDESDKELPYRTFAQYPPYPHPTFESKESLPKGGSSRREITGQPSSSAGGSQGIVRKHAETPSQSNKIGNHGVARKQAEAPSQSNKIDIVCPPGTRPVIHIPPSGTPAAACVISRPEDKIDCCSPSNPCSKHRKK